MHDRLLISNAVCTLFQAPTYILPPAPRFELQLSDIHSAKLPPE